MTARENLNEMKQFMGIARGDLPQINESQMIELGGVTHHKNRVPIQYYDEFKANNPGSRIRFRGPRHGKAHTSKVDATHFYIERVGPPVPKETRDELEGMRSPHRPEDRPHTPGYNKLETPARAAADSRAQAYIFDDLDEDLDPDGMGHYEVVVRRGVGTDDFYEDVVSGPLPLDQARKEALEHVRMIKGESDTGAKVKKSYMKDQEGWSIRPNSYSLDDKYSGGFVFIRQAEDADVEAWYGESIKLGDIVENVLEEFPGQPKDYVDPEDKSDEPTQQYDDEYSSEIEDEELGLRFD